MKEHFISKNFNPDARALLRSIMPILADYASQGYDLSLRQLYYQLVAKDLIPHDRSYAQRDGKWVPTPYGVNGSSTNAEPNYKWIGDVVSDARLAGLIDWDMIQDRGRTVSSNPHWENPRRFIDIVAPQFALDKWLDQPNYVEVMVEKQALEGVLEPLCSELDIKFAANKGYSSSSALYKAGKRFAHKLSDEKKCHIIYLGDHDPSGIDMSRDIEERINLFAGVVDEERLKEINQMRESINVLIEADELDGVMVHRVALNMDQIRQLRPPENPAKITDPRADDYIAKFGRKSWELDAIEPRALAKLVRDKVHDLRDPDIWEKSYKRETAMRNELLALAKKSKFK